MTASSSLAVAPTLSALRDALQHGRAGVLMCDRPSCADDPAAYAIWRFSHRWATAEDEAFGADLLVLLRQAIRWQPQSTLWCRVDDRVREAIERYPDAGLSVSGASVTAAPYRPHWLVAAERVGEIDGPPERRRLSEHESAEPYLGRVFHFKTWQSPAQKEAVWRVLTAPAGATTLAALPTGAGKSLCFQALASFHAGLTVVIVPTVALALDHYRSAQKDYRDVSSIAPQYYVSNDPDHPSDQVREVIRERRCRLLFTSPEACVTGRLRSVLDEAAAQGWFTSLVIDEAHLVETWGAHFRTDFQNLSALRRRWRQRSGGMLRTVLLSATLTSATRQMLRALFCEESTPWSEFVSQRVRPEMTYFAHEFATTDARQAAVLDGCWQLPRPMILYATTPHDTKQWADRLREVGFSRVGCYHGHVSPPERRQLLAAWHDDALDIMVGNSAFGLGVDKSDVRTVMHACLPEDMHRYYQEVGRSGRDGASSVCALMVHRAHDAEVNRRLRPKLLLPRTIQRRWESLWQSATPTVPNVRWLQTDAKPVHLTGERTGRWNRQWNKSLLLQLVRAGLLELVDLKRRREASDGASRGRLVESIAVRPLFPPYSRTVGERLREDRQREQHTLRSGHVFLDTYLRGERCIGHILQEAYGAGTAYCCGGCAMCRRQGRVLHCPPLPLGEVPRASTHHEIVAGVPSLDSSRIVVELRACFRAGITRFFVAPPFVDALRSLMDEVATESSVPYRVDVIDHPPLDFTSASWGVILHIDRIIDSAFDLQVGGRMTHWLAASLHVLDAESRRPRERDGVRFYPTLDQWLTTLSHVH